ncbi:MAG: dihydrofolate reductase, partial [Defluviitaleaceae bacterium]|nr:dihydrofolate reductase [Defluviitaleaceae bacterium]
MNLIAAVSSDWGIGFENNLLFHIREDLIYFKKMTTKKICVMGYNTLISLPDSKPLKNRTTVVLSRKKNLKIDGAIVCDSLESLDAVLSEFDERDVFVCGGEKIYSQLINRCKTAYITKVDANP